MNVDRLYSRAVNQLTGFLGEEFKGSYYRTMYDLQTVNGFSSNFSTINAELVEKTLAYPWSGANFSDRLWKNKNALIDTIRETLTQGMIRGDSIRDMTRAVAEKLGSSLKNAERVVRTETSHIHNTAEIEAYKAGGYEQYEFMASFGERTCEVCGGLDGQHFKLKNIQYGVNFPPVHPNCRCTTVCWDEADKEQKALEGQKALDYEKWYRKYVTGREQPKLESKQSENFTANALNPQPIIPENDGISAHKFLTNKENGDIIQSKRKPFQELNFSCRTNKQQEHIFGTKRWEKVSDDSVEKGNNPKSYFYPDVDIETLVRGHIDENELKYTSRSEFPRFYFTAETPIGKTFDRTINGWIDTKRVMVVFSSKGWHAVPVIDKR